MVFPPFYSISLRCRLLEGFSFGFVFGFSLSCRLLEASWFVTQKGCVVEGSGWENELSKKSENATWFFAPVYSISVRCRLLEGMSFGTPHGFPSFYSVSFRCRLLEGFSFAGRFWAGKPIYQKKIKRHMVYLFSFK